MLAPRQTEVVESGAQIDRAVSRISTVIGGTSLQLALTIGRVVIEELYGGDLTRWRRRGPKDYSLRQLANDPRLTISASALFRAISIYEIKIRMADHPLWNQLTMCHLRAVLGLPEREQDLLLERATAENWSILALEQAASHTRSEHKNSRGGRPRKPRFARSIDLAEKLFAKDDAVFGDLDALDEMTPERRAELARRLQLVRQRCDRLAVLIAG